MSELEILHKVGVSQESGGGVMFVPCSVTHGISLVFMEHSFRRIGLC